MVKTEHFTLTGMDELEEFVQNFQSSIFKAASAAGMTAALKYLYRHIPDYPPEPPAGRWWKLATPKQKRWFWYMLGKHGSADFMARTNHMETTYQYMTSRRGSAVFGAIGIGAAYAPWVVGPDPSEAITIGGVKMYQAPIHQGRWWQWHTVISENLDDAYGEMVDEIWGALEAAYDRRPGAWWKTAATSMGRLRLTVWI